MTVNQALQIIAAPRRKKRREAQRVLIKAGLARYMWERGPSTAKIIFMYKEPKDD